MTGRYKQYWMFLVLIGLVGIIIFQAVSSWRGYVKPWFDTNKGYIVVSSPQRSAILFLDRDRARFLRFLDSYLSNDAAIVLPPKPSSFSSQSIMQNFLYPRPILACCGSDNALCQKCLDDSNNYILPSSSFPLPEEQSGRVFVTYPQATNSLRGIYVPQDKIDQLRLPDPLVYGKTQPITIKALLIDLCIISSLFLLGSVFVAVLLKEITWSDLMEFSIPLSMGFMSWGLFILSYLGVPLTLSLVLLLFICFLVVSVFIYRFLYMRYPWFPNLQTLHFPAKWKFTDIFFVLLTVFAFMAFIVIAVLAVGRGYSMFDDIVNWSFKGYAMVDSGTIWAGNDWGGHVLAYPMNLQLSIGIFRLADGDVIPGSKFLYVLLTFSLLFGSYRFLVRNCVNRVWAVSGVLALLLVPMFLFHATIGFANLPFTVYMVLGVLHSFEGLRSLEKPLILLGGILLALAAWTRPEGLYFGIAFLGLMYLLAIFVLKSKVTLKHGLLSILPVLIIPGSWMVLMGIKGMSDDQIGLALKALLKSYLQGNFSLDSVLTLSQYAYQTFYNVSFILLLFALAVIIFSVPLTRWYTDKFKLSLAVLDFFAFFLPTFMFYGASFNEKNFVVFLDQSFNRAYLPALTMTMIVALLAITNRATDENQSPLGGIKNP
jgi:hypothetical protein